MKATTTLVLGGLLFAGTALAADPQQAATTTPTTNDESGMRVGIDARTGKLRPLTAAENAQLDAVGAKNRKTTAQAKGKTASKAGLITFVAANGMGIVELNDTHMTEVQATVGADGKVAVNHDGQPVQGAVEAAHE